MVPVGDEAALVDIGTLSGRLGVSERTLRRLVASNAIPYVRVGAQLRFDPAEVRAVLAVPARKETAMPLDPQAIFDRDIERARNTWVAPHVGGWIIVAHPGQELNRDPEYLLKNFGILDPASVQLMADVDELRPLSPAEKEEIRMREAATVQERIELVEAQLRELREERDKTLAAIPPKRGKPA